MGFRIRAWRGQPRFAGKRRIVPRKPKVAKPPKAEPLSSNEILMRRMKEAGVQPDPDHTESEHHGQS